jgi:L-alanine-DL-glutamate epimerase-like enolase superfamily enzyme
MDVRIDRIDVNAYTVPTDFPESDGTLEWNETTIVIAEATAGGARGLGYTYADQSTALLIRNRLAAMVVGLDAMDTPGAWRAMVRSVRNLGRPGIASVAVSAVDTALWDLKARMLGVPLVTLFGQVRQHVPAYGSGGFTSYPVPRLQSQLREWAEAGISRVKMKVGREPEHDVDRVRAAREAIGDSTELFVDANGAYDRKEALAMAEAFAMYGVRWFEEPVSSDDLDGLRLLRDRGPAGMAIAAGEYGYDLPYFTRMLDAGAIDVLQADATRCAGFSEFLRVGALCQARGIPLSAHTAPSLHAHCCCALDAVCHVELFHDHWRIESMFFDGAPSPVDGQLEPDRSRPGMGLELKRADAAQYAA